MSDLTGRTTIVIGASWGLGRGIARAFAEAGAPVDALARTGPALAEMLAREARHRCRAAYRGLFSFPYSLNCLEGEFSEIRLRDRA